MFGKSRRFGKFENFSAVVSAVAVEQGATQHAYEELRVFGAPSECGTLIARSNEHRLDEILSSAGLSVAEYNEELRVRTNDKFAYFSGLEIWK